MRSWPNSREKQRRNNVRLIDADALLKHECEADRMGAMLVVGKGYILDAPTIDAMPVVRGEWIMDTDPDDGDCRCSNCHVCIDALHRRNHPTLKALGYKLHTFYKYCPNCGAKMDGGTP